MQVVSNDSWSRPRPDQGPAIYWGYCNQQRRYRLMNLAEGVQVVAVARNADEEPSANGDAVESGRDSG